MCALRESGFERTHRIGITVFSDFPLFEPGRLICSRIPSLKAGCMVEICRIDKSMRLDVARTPWPCPSGFPLLSRPPDDDPAVVSSRLAKRRQDGTGEHPRFGARSDQDGAVARSELQRRTPPGMREN